MVDDWQPGDLALCVNNTDWHGVNPHGKQLVRGRAYVVLAVVPAAGWVDAPYACGLIIEGPQNSGPNGDWHEARFRKINPHTPDAEDVETIRLLNNAPVKETEPCA